MEPKRPPSAKPRSHINPITGEEMLYSARGTPMQHFYQTSRSDEQRHELRQGGGLYGSHQEIRRQNRPESVPKLSLGKLADEGDNDFTLEMDPYYKQESDRSTTISWGTPSSVAANRKLQDLQHYSDLSSLRISDKKEEPISSQRDPLSSYNHQPSERRQDSKRHDLEKDWVLPPYSKAAEIRLQDKESLEEINRKKKLIETVMIDQLSRPVISQPRRGALSHRRTTNRGSARAQQDLNVCIGTATENLLLKRVQFGARVITRNGRDAIRELTGFYFAVDNSITVYEFRKFGKSAKALPFIQRGTYNHLVGPKQGNPYTLKDIKQGDCLMFATNNQPLPDAMKSNDIAILKVTEVDDDAKASILFENVPLDQQDKVWNKAHIPQTEEEINTKLLLMKVQECVRSQICKRGIKVFTCLCSLYHKLDEDKTGSLNKVELDKSLLDFHIEVPQELFEDLWEALDTNCTGFMEYHLFMHAYLGEMSEKRKSFVLKAFRKLDSSKKGEVTFDDVRKFYNAHKHPRVRSGECSESEILDYFLSHFSNTATKDSITFFEFESYYEGLSICMESDEDFNKVLQNEWGI